MLIELFLAVLGGAGVALGIAAYLGRAFLKLQADKILARHTQALTIEKERLGHDLAIEFHQKSITITRREQDRTEALKSLHATLVNLGAAVIKLPSLAKIKINANFESAYFTCLSTIFTELSGTFTRIAEAHRVLELNAIYLDAVTEQQINQTLVTIQRYYDEVLTTFNEILAQAQSLSGQLSEISQPVKLPVLCSEIVGRWNLIVEPSKMALKHALREKLQA